MLAICSHSEIPCCAIVTGTHSVNWILCRAYKMRLWGSDMYYTLFDGFPQCPNADCLPPSFKLNQADGGILHEPVLFIRGNAINLTLQLVSNTLCISEAPAPGFCLRIGYPVLKLQSRVGRSVWCPVSVVFGCSFHNFEFFGKYTSGTGCLDPDFLQSLSVMMLKWFIEKVAYYRCHLMNSVLHMLYCLLTISIWPSGCCLSCSIQAHLKLAMLCWGNHFHAIHNGLLS